MGVPSDARRALAHSVKGWVMGALFVELER